MGHLHHRRPRSDLPVELARGRVVGPGDGGETWVALGGYVDLQLIGVAGRRRQLADVGVAGLGLGLLDVVLQLPHGGAHRGGGLVGAGRTEVAQAIVGLRPQIAHTLLTTNLKTGWTKAYSLDEKSAAATADFLIYSSLTTVARRPGTNVSYTSNWPYEPLVGNGPTPATFSWTWASFLFTFLMFGVVAVTGTYYVQAAAHLLSAANWYFVASALPFNAFIVGLPVGALVTNVLLIDDIRDHRPDRDKGWRTGAVRFGVGWNRAEIVVLSAFAYLMPFWLWLGRGFSPWVLLPLLTLPQAVTVARVVCTSNRFEDLFPMTPKGAFLSLWYGALLAIGTALPFH